MMFRPALHAALLLFAAVCAPFPLHAQSDLQQQLIAADRGLLEALAGPHADVERYQRALAPDYTDVSFGAAHSREEDVQQAKVIRDFSFQYENPRAVLLSPTAGYVLAEVRYSGVMNGSGFQSHVISTTVFSLQQGRWIAHLQMVEPMQLAAAAAAAVPDNDPTLVALRRLAAQVEAKVQVKGHASFDPPSVKLDAGTGVSYYAYDDKTVHSARFDDLPAPMQGFWKQWSSYTTDEPSGKSLFDDMFHRFFFVHELGHWMAAQVIAGLPDSEMLVVAKNEGSHKWEREVAANRIAVAWYREHDPQYLEKLVADFRRIQAPLPDPVPAGIDKKAYFTENYAALGNDPMAYGWYQLQIVLVAYDEPARSFQQVLDALPANRYE